MNAAQEPRPLAPMRALTTKTWLIALLVLGLNDHALKHADLLPELVTGKLSDVAGMFVAPALLAALLRVRSRAALAACYLAVGGVFTLINLSPAAASLWSRLLGLVGVGWVTVCDPTDVLVALPSLWLAWRLLAPPTARAPDLSLEVPLEVPLEAPRWCPRRRLELASLCVGALLCTATSRPPPEFVPAPPPPEFIPPAPAEGVVVATMQAVAGHIELRCTDGARVEEPFEMEEPWRRYGWVVFKPTPAPGVECKIKVLGAPGTYGPISAETPLVWCDVSPTSPLRCQPGEHGEPASAVEW